MFDIKIQKLVDAEKEVIAYETNVFLDMIEETPEDLDGNMKFAREHSKRLKFLCELVHKGNEADKNAE